MDNTIVCPICKQTKLQNFDICKNCFWEFDKLQYENPDMSGGANFLSINDYKKWWDALNSIMPQLMKTYNVNQSKLAHWKYDELIVPRENIKQFVSFLSNHNICVRPSFYHLCDKYNLNPYTFEGFPILNFNSATENCKELIELIFTNDPMKTCEKYKLTKIGKFLKHSDSVKFWEEITPHICILPNPKFLPL